jgi:hypothetical protein
MWTDFVVTSDPIGREVDLVPIRGEFEQRETESDPFPSTGWTDASGAENGEKCPWTGLQNNPNAGGFPTQPLWSNASNAGPRRLRAVLLTAR